MEDIALLVLRAVFGLLLAGHGAQKLFGWFGGPGFRGTTGWLGSLNLKPAPLWGAAAGMSEFAGGVLLALGFLSPVGAVAVIAAMVMAILLVHIGKGLWASNGGIELPLAIGAVAFALLLSGPGRYSLDAALGVSVPSVVVYLASGAALVSVVFALISRRTSGSVGQASEA
ncbi:MAG: DoxX family protein [Trueperaceae bacterium]